MFRSLEVLKNLPGNEEREQTCESFKQSLLSALRPRLLRDAVDRNVTPLQEYLYVYQRLGRESELEEEFVKLRPKKYVMHLWDEYLAEHRNEESIQNEEFATWLAVYLGKVARYLADEQEGAGTLFGPGRGASVLCKMLARILPPVYRSEERRVGKECRSRWSPYH